MDIITCESANREWKKNFSFLKITGLEYLYLGILAMAQSKTEVFDLHKVLPANEKIFRDDLIKLGDFWEKYIKPRDKHYTAQDWLIGMLSGGRNNNRYYLDYIKSKRIELKEDDRRNFCRGDLILSSKLREGRGGVHFLASLISQKTSQQLCNMGIECYLSKNKERIVVKLVTYSGKLTEPIAYFLSNLPEYAMFSDSWGQYGAEVDLAYSLPIDNLKDKLVSYINSNSPSIQYYIGKVEFVAALQERLREYGIPVGDIYPMSRSERF
jgi:hypothetical protein